MRKNKKHKDPQASKESFFEKLRPFWLFFVAGIVIFIVLPKIKITSEERLSWIDFEQKILNRNAVEKIVVVNSDYAEIYIKKAFRNDSGFKEGLKAFYSGNPNGPDYYLSIGSIDSFDRKLENAEKALFQKEIIPVTYIKRSDSIMPVFLWLLPFIVLFILWNWIFSRGRTDGNGSIFSFNKSTATLFNESDKNLVTFKDVAGLEEAQMEVKEIVNFLKNPEIFTRLGAKIPKGVILVGPPGSGKTLLAKAVAGEARVPFFSISGSEFVEMFVGVGASRVRDLFKKAKEKAPCIIFIDEIDAIGRSRSSNAIFTGANDERESTLNQLLTEMDGFSTNSGIIVLAATNRGDMLDPALLRAGRFDRHIYLELPNQKEREEIFKVHVRPLMLDPKVDIHFLAAQTPGFSGADIANLCNEAALIAARSRKKEVQQEDFMEAIDRIVAGPEKKSKIISDNEKRIIAFHEAGHAVVSWRLKNVDPLVKVSIIPRGRSLGASWYLPEEKQIKTFPEFQEQLAATLGGRAAEEVMFHEVSSGAMDDLAKATKEAYMMVSYFGFNQKMGPMSFYGETESALRKPYSEETGKLIDEEVRNVLKDAYQRSIEVLMKNKAALTALAELLLKQEIADKSDLEKILGERGDLNPEISEQRII